VTIQGSNFARLTIAQPLVLSRGMVCEDAQIPTARGFIKQTLDLGFAVSGPFAFGGGGLVNYPWQSSIEPVLSYDVCILFEVSDQI